MKQLELFIVKKLGLLDISNDILSSLSDYTSIICKFGLTSNLMPLEMLSLRYFEVIGLDIYVSNIHWYNFILSLRLKYLKKYIESNKVVGFKVNYL